MITGAPNRSGACCLTNYSGLANTQSCIHSDDSELMIWELYTSSAFVRAIHVVQLFNLLQVCKITKC